MAIATPHGSSRTGRPALYARYATLEHSRDAMRSLEAAGVDGADVSLAGEAAREVEESTPRRRADRRILSSVTAALTVGILGGLLAGAVLGAVLVGIAMLFWNGGAGRGWVYGLMVAWFATGGAVLGAIAAIARTVGFSESMPLTWSDQPEHPVWLAVFGDDEAELQERVEATEPLEVIDDPERITAHPDLAPEPSPSPR